MEIKGTAIFRALKNSFIFTFIILGAVICLSGCHKKEQVTSDYVPIRDRWLSVLKNKLDKAYLDPEAKIIINDLAHIKPSNVDYQLAATLKAEIEKGRAEALERQKAAKETINLVYKTNQSPSISMGGPPPTTKPTTNIADNTPSDGGTTNAESKISIGMESKDFERQFSRCFEYKSAALVGGMAGGQVWGLKDLAICRDLHKDFVTNSVLLMDGKIAAISTNEELAPKKYNLVNGQLVPANENSSSIKKIETTNRKLNQAPNE